MKKVLRKLSPTIIGVDPGQKGGIAVWENGLIKSVHEIPIIGKEYDEYSLQAIFREIVESCLTMRLIGFLEKASAMPKQGVTSTFKFGMGYGLLRGMLSCNLIPYKLVTPQAWKKLILAGIGKDKKATIAYIQRRYPGVNLIPGRRRTPHDGIADAICIAEYGSRTETGDL